MDIYIFDECELTRDMATFYKNIFHHLTKHTICNSNNLSMHPSVVTKDIQNIKK